LYVYTGTTRELNELTLVVFNKTLTTYLFSAALNFLHNRAFQA